jgi:aldehyde dehydrogenase (NAD+)
MSTNRVIVDAKVHDEFVDRFTTHVKGLKYGNPNDPDVSIGPIINKKQLATHMAHIQGARDAGASQVLGGDPTDQVLPAARIRECQERDADRSGRIVRPDRPYYQSEWRS